jgi:hypothetical protein
MTQYVLATVKIEVPDGVSARDAEYDTSLRLNHNGYQVENCRMYTRPMSVDHQGGTFGQPRVLTGKISIPVYGEHDDEAWESWLTDALIDIEGAFIDKVTIRDMRDNETFY